MPWLVPVALVLGFAALFVALHAVLVAPQQLTVSEHEVPIADLPAAFERWTMAVLSDIHAPPYGRHGQLRRAAAVAEAARPDAILLLGDYASSFGRLPEASARFYRQAMPRAGEILGALHAPDGVFAVLGNHDHYFDGTAVAAWLRALGPTLLVNEHVVLRRGDACLVLGGVDDYTESDVDRAAGCRGAPDAPTIVMAHHPDSVVCFTERRRIDLVLSGHTHGGQVVLPWYGALMTLSRVCTRRHPAGWVPNGRAPLFVSRGVGGDIPLRVNCPPEVAIVRLVRGTGAPRLVRQWALRGARWARRPGGGRRRPAPQQPA